MAALDVWGLEGPIPLILTPPIGIPAFEEMNPVRVFYGFEVRDGVLYMRTKFGRDMDANRGPDLSINLTTCVVEGTYDPNLKRHLAKYVNRFISRFMSV